MEFKVLILDFDGVVVESNDIKHQAFAKIYKPYAKHYEEIMTYHRAHNAVNRYVKFRHILEEILQQPFDQELVRQWAEEFSTLTRKAIINCPYVEGAEDFLKYFSTRYPLYLASATPIEELNIILTERGLLKYFRDFYGAPTPKIDMFQDIAKRENAASRDILFIGDSQEDFAVAKRFDCQFLARRSDHNFVGDGTQTYNDLFEVTEAIAGTITPAGGRS